MTTPPASDGPAPHSRWHFLRDVLVLQLKLALGNLLNFVLVPASLIAAAMDLLMQGEREGQRFYAVLDWARRVEEGINVYGAIGGYHGGAAAETGFDVDTVIRRVETVVVRECDKGGTAAQLKSAVDRALDQLRRERGGKPGPRDETDKPASN